MTPLAPLLQAFFIERIAKERQASPHTTSAYRTTFSLLLRFARDRLGKAPSHILLDELSAPLVASFLHHLEVKRKNSVRTRNARLAAIHSFFRYIAVLVPDHADQVKRVLDIPHKRFDRRLVDFLSEFEALLAAPDRRTWIGRRDHAFLLIAIQTGLRASELANLRIDQIVTGTQAHIRCTGKGRKERCTPLTRQTMEALRAWLKEREGAPGDPVFPSYRRGALSLDALEKIVKKHATTAANTCLRCTTSGSPRTCCATPPPCSSDTPGSTCPSSPCGSAMSPSRRLRFTSTPISRAGRRPSLARHPFTTATGDIVPPTICSPSSPVSDYAASTPATTWPFAPKSE
jgi:integrase